MRYFLAENVEIATKVNQEIQTALDPKELESFARQIASGMVRYTMVIYYLMLKHRMHFIVTLIEPYPGSNLHYTTMPPRCETTLAQTGHVPPKIGGGVISVRKIT